MHLARRQLVALGTAALLAGPVVGQTQKAIRIVLPFPPGGGADAVMRIIAQQLMQQLGPPVIIDNKPGADGVIAASEVVRAAPDGTTLFFASGNSMVSAPLLRGRPAVPYDPFKDFTPIGSLGRFTMVMLVAPGVPVSTLAELVAYVRARPGQLNYASGFITARLAAMQLMNQYKLEMQNVPYKGDAGALTDLMSDRVQVMFTTAAAARGFVNDHKVRALLVLRDTRSPVLPDVPTMKETGARIAVSPWAGLYGPANLPPVVVDRINQALRGAMAGKQIRDQLEQLGYEPVPSTPEEMAAIHRGEYEIFRKAVQEDGVKFE